MAGWKSKYLGRASGSASDPNLANDLQQSSGEQPSPPTTSRTSHFFGKFKRRSLASSPSAEVEPRSSAANPLIAMPLSQPLATPAIQSHTSSSEASVQQTHGPTICVLPQVTVTAVPSGAYNRPSSSDIQGPPFVSASVELEPLAKLDDISTIPTHTHKVAEGIHNHIKDDKILQLLTMLTPLEPLKRHYDVKLPRAENTGTWLLRLDTFRKWRDSDTARENVFCCYGIPGAGKTVLCSIAVDHLYSRLNKHSNIGIACLYADYHNQSNQTLTHILGSFVRQLLTSAQVPIPDEIIQKLNRIQYYNREVGTEDTLEFLKVQLRQLKCAFICIDAVDELGPKVRQQLLSILKELATNSNIRLFLTGRGHIETEVQNHFEIPQGYTVNISANQDDIREFVRQQIRENYDGMNPEAMDEVLAKDIENTIIEKSKGTFLIPALHIKTVLDMPTYYQRQEALKTLPTDIYESFQGITTRIRRSPNRSHAELGIQVLMWLHFAKRSLQLQELQHALAVQKSHTEFSVGNVPSQKVLLDCCLGLVVVDKETSTVRFMHHTLEEYFHKNTAAEFPNGCCSIAETCLTYLNFGKLRQPCTSLGDLKETLKEYAFLDYAARYWGIYVKQQQCDNGLTELVIKLVDHETERPPCAIQALYFGLDRLAPITWKFSGIHVAAYFGLSEGMTYFCNLDKHVIELEDDSNRTPLSWAAIYGHEPIVQVLIDQKDVNINSKDKDGRTPLSLAAGAGHEAVVRRLIERGDVDVNVKDRDGRTPLSWAVGNGHEAVVRLLADRDDVDLGVKEKHGQTLLSLAAENGHEAVVRVLIDRDDVDVNVKDQNGRTPLSSAAGAGHEAIVRLLIERDDVDVNVKDNDGQTPLSWASKRGREAAVRLLIEKDHDVNVKDNWSGQTPLSLAAENGHEAVVRLLIERDDVDVNVLNRKRQTPLSLAAQSGHEAVVRLLVARDDIDVNVKNDQGWTPFCLAAARGYEAIVRVLIERDDIDVDTKDNDGCTPFSWAAGVGSPFSSAALADWNKAMARMLIHRDDVDVNVKDDDGWTPLLWAAGRGGNEATVRLLVDRDDVDVNIKGNDGQTPLSRAAGNGNEAIVRLLIGRGDIDVNIEDNHGRTPLSLAAGGGHEATVRLLINRDDVEVHVKDNDGRTPLSWAAGGGHEVVVQLLNERLK